MAEREGVERREPGEWGAFGALLAMSGLAFAQPVLSSFGDSPETFIFNGSSAGQIVLFALGVALVPPVVLWLVLRLIRAVWPAARQTALALMVGGLAALFVAGVVGDLSDVRRLVRVGAGVLVAVGTALLYRRAAPFRSFLTALALAPALFVTSFLFMSPTSELVSGGEDVEAIEDVVPTKAENLVVIVLDEIPTAGLVDGEGKLDAERYPNLAELAGDSTWFRNFATVSADTVHAVPAMLSGQYPEGGTVPYWGDHPDNLFTLLGGSFNLNVHESMTALCAPTICEDAAPVDPAAASSSAGSPTAGDASRDGGMDELWSEAWDLWREWVGLSPTRDRFAQFEESLAPSPPSAATTTSGPTGSSPDVSTPPPVPDESLLDGEHQPARVGAFDDALATTPSPALHFVHLVLPHRPYRTLPDGATYDPLPWPDIGLGFPAEWTDQWFADLARQRMTWQMQYTDQLVGDVIDSLKEADIYDTSVVVVVGDHGAGFQPGEGFRLPEDENRHELLWSPFFVKQANQRDGTIDDTPLSSVDVLPTMADVLGVTVPWDLPGSSGFDLDAEHPDDRPFYVFKAPPFQPDPDAVYETDGAAEFRRMLDSGSPPTTSALTDVLYDGFAHRRLVGQSVDDLRVATEASGVTASLNPSGLGRGEPLELPPAVVIGRIEPDGLGAAPMIALAIDGVIEAVSPVLTYDGGDPAFAFAMPTIDARTGGDPVQLYLVSGDPTDLSSVLLSPVDRSD